MLFLMDIQEHALTVFCEEIWQWFDRHKRTLPWRDREEDDVNHRAYLVLVSEIMLQQTQVSRVIVLYRQFLEQFPTMHHLAISTNADVLRAWKGLGYNNRALRLRDAVRCIVEQHDGLFPREMDALQALKGIGHYTAGAVRNFAFHLPTPCIDTNIRRILHRFFIGPENDDGTWVVADKELLVLAEQALSKALHLRHNLKNSADWHAALMDFGSMVCTKNNPAWHLLSPSLRSICVSYGWQSSQIKRPKAKAEPGRMIAGKFVPRRILRGRIISALREHPQGLSVADIGVHMTVDRDVSSDHPWIEDILLQLERDHLITQKKNRWILSEE